MDVNVTTPSSNAEVKNDWSLYLRSPYTISWQGREAFTSLLLQIFVHWWLDADRTFCGEIKYT
jgi:hypothetical protein